MMRHGRSDALPGAATAAVAVACCAGLPALGSVVGGLALATVLGVAGGVLVTAAIIAALLGLRSRRRRRCEVASRRPIP